MHKNTSRNRHATTLFLLLIATLPTRKIQAQWDIEDSHTTAGLRGIHNVGGGVAWASGTNGTVLRTEDGGYLWQTCTIPPGAEKLDFRGIQAFDENTAIVMSSGKGDLSRLYKTTDGCQTWKLLFTNPDKEGFWDAIKFRFDPVLNPTPNHQHGVLVGDPVDGKFAIFISYDQGETWSKWEGKGVDQEQRPATSVRGEGMFAASNSSVASPAMGSVFAFVTGGESGARLLYPKGYAPFDGKQTWRFTAQKLSFPVGQSSGAFAVAPVDNHAVWSDLMIVGGDYKFPDKPSPAFFVPSREHCCKGGLFQQQIIMSLTPPHGYRSSVAYDPTQKLWITVGPNGTDISRDDGKNWTPLKPSGYDPPDADKNWNALSLPFVVGPHGRIGRLRTIPNPSK
jgi:hypothetical protein